MTWLIGVVAVLVMLAIVQDVGRRRCRAQILAALEYGGEWTGVRLWAVTGYGPGRIYPILYALEEQGVIVSRELPLKPEREHRQRAYRLAAEPKEPKP